MKKTLRIMTNVLATVLCGVLIALIATPLMLPKDLRVEVDLSQPLPVMNSHDDMIAHPLMMERKSDNKLERLLTPQYDSDVQPAVFMRKHQFVLELTEV